MSIKIKKVSKVFSDGKHNAFTSICQYQGNCYLAFRNAENHLSENGQIIIIRSDSKNKWHLICRVKDENGDLRDPKLLAFDDKLILYAGLRIKSKNTYKIKSVVYVSEGGENFQKKRLKGINDNDFIWGISVYKNTIYSSAYTYLVEDVTEQNSQLYKSSNGFDWELITSFPGNGNETYLEFDQHDRLFALVRDEKQPNFPTLYVSQKANFSTFDKIQTLPLRLQGFIFKRFESGYFLAGRTWDIPGRQNLRTQLFWYEEDGKLKSICTLPSGGDCSYPSWCCLRPGKALLSYYSAHEQIEKSSNATEHNCSADIFLAELSF